MNYNSEMGYLVAPIIRRFVSAFEQKRQDEFTKRVKRNDIRHRGVSHDARVIDRNRRRRFDEFAGVRGERAGGNDDEQQREHFTRRGFM